MNRFAPALAISSTHYIQKSNAGQSNIISMKVKFVCTIQSLLYLDLLPLCAHLESGKTLSDDDKQYSHTLLILCMHKK